jgi:cytochrome c peroxidase
VRSRSLRFRPQPLLLALTLVGTLAGCGGSSSPPGSAPSRTVPPPVSADSISNLIAAAAAPEPANLSDFVKNKEAAIQLGKAFFWDMQVGSDGQQACATCHHSAGADSRIANTVHAGPRNSGVPRGTPLLPVPDGTLMASMFPLPLAVNDVVASQGLVTTDFVSILPGTPVDQGAAPPPP